MAENPIKSVYGGIKIELVIKDPTIKRIITAVCVCGVDLAAHYRIPTIKALKSLAGLFSSSDNSTDDIVIDDIEPPEFLLVKLSFFTQETSLKFLDYYESGLLKKALATEFAKIDILDESLPAEFRECLTGKDAQFDADDVLTVKIRNEKEVENYKNKMNRKIDARHPGVKGNPSRRQKTYDNPHVEHSISGFPALVSSVISSVAVNPRDTIKTSNPPASSSVDEQQPETNVEMNNSAQNSFGGRTRRKKNSLISSELISSLMSIQYVQGFGFIDNIFTIHLSEDCEKETEQAIEDAMHENPFAGGHCIKPFLKTDYTKLHSVGGYGLYRESRYPRNSCNVDGTIGCLLKFQEGQGNDTHTGKIYAVTCCHVVRPDECDDLISFQTTVDDRLENLKSFSKEIEFRKLDVDVPVDIALLPVDKSCDAFNFKHGECKAYDGEISELNEKKVQKQGAKTGLTEGKIKSFDYTARIEGKVYLHTMMVESTMAREPFSEPGDSGSLVTLSRNPDEETHVAVAMVFGGGELEGKKVSYTFNWLEGINLLLEECRIYNEYDILSEFRSETLGCCETTLIGCANNHKCCLL